MASVPSSEYSLRAGNRRLTDRFGDVALVGITLAAALGAVVLLGAIVWKVIDSRVAGYHGVRAGIHHT